MIESTKHGLFIDGNKYTDNDKRVFDIAWEIDLDQEDYPIINRYFSIRKNDDDKVYLYDEIQSDYEGFSGVRQRITTGPDYRTLYNYVMEKYEEAQDDITGKYINFNGGFHTDIELEDIEGIEDVENYPGTSAEMKKTVLFESSLTAFDRHTLAPIVAYIGGVCLAD